MEQTNYKYYAFISYTHADKKWAKWLHRKLETYRLPSKLQKEHGVAKYTKPVFRDKTDLPPGHIDTKINAELSKSQHLIVVCSKNLAGHYDNVTKEIEEFIRLGREKYIIPFIIDGNPNANDAKEECFPPALKELGILGGNVPDDGKNKAFIRVLSGILGLGFDDLWDRDKRRRRLRNILLSALACILVIASIFMWDFYVPKVSYYDGYIEIYGVAKGVGEKVSSEDRHEIQYSYKITEKENKVICVEKVDRNDKLYDERMLYNFDKNIEIRPAKVIYTYDDTVKGNDISYATLYNSKDTPIVKYQYDSMSKQKKNASYRLIRVGTEDESGFVMKWSVNMIEDLSLNTYEEDPRSSVTGFKLIFDDKGRISEKKYTNSIMTHNNNVYDTRYISGERYTYYDDDRLKSISFIDKNGKIINDESNDIGIIEYEYEENVITTSYMDRNGQSISGKVARIQEINDKDYTTKFFYGGATNEDELLGCIYEYAHGKNPITKRVFSGNIFDEFSCSTNIYLYDKNVIKRILFYDGEFTDDSDLFIKDKDKNKSYYPFKYFDYEYNTDGLVKSITIYDKDGFVDKEGYEYGDSNNIELLTKYDKYGLIKYSTKIVYESGLVKEELVFDSTNEKCINDLGFCLKKNEYNRLGNLTETKYYDSNDELSDNIYGYSNFNCIYDTFSQLVYAEYINTKKLMVNGGEFGKYTAQKNSNDIIISREYVLLSEEYGDWITHSIKYDDNQNIIFQYYNIGIGDTVFDENMDIKNQQDLIRIGDYSLFYAEYDDNIVRNKVFLDYIPSDLNLIPYLVSEAIPVSIMSYDKDGKITSMDGLYEDDRVIFSHEFDKGIIKKAKVYDNIYPLTNEIIYLTERMYNKNGDLVSEKYYNSDEKLSSEGTLCTNYEVVFNEGKVAEKVFYNYKSDFFGTVPKYARKYNENEFVILESYYDENNTLVNSFSIESILNNIKLSMPYKDKSKDKNTIKNFMTNENSDSCISISYSIVDGYGNCVVDGRYNFVADEISVSDALGLILDELNIPLVVDGNYIYSIGGLSNERQIAWNYYVNGQTGNNYANFYMLSDDDKVVWTYMNYANYN